MGLLRSSLYGVGLFAASAIIFTLGRCAYIDGMSNDITGTIISAPESIRRGKYFFRTKGKDVLLAPDGNPKMQFSIWVEDRYWDPNSEIGERASFTIYPRFFNDYPRCIGMDDIE